MALKGIKVLEFAGLAPGPFCGKILSDFGASVIRIDRVGAQLDMDCLCSGKKSIALNLKDIKGQKIIKQLSKQADVLIEPFRKGIMESLGLGPDILLKENPRLIYSRLTGYGQDGPYSSKAGHDINYLALSGLLSLFGRKNDKPTFPVNVVADFGGGGLMCALGILMALLERSKSNLGQVIDNSMVNGSIYMGSWLYNSQNLPGLWGNKRGENILDSGSHFYDVYLTKDGKYISVGALEPKFYDELLRGLGYTSEEAPHFGGDTEKIKEMFSKRFLEKTSDEWMLIFEKLDACVAPVLTLEEAPKFSHNIVQKSFIKHDDKYIPAPAPNLSRTPGKQNREPMPL